MLLLLLFLACVLSDNMVRRIAACRPAWRSRRIVDADFAFENLANLGERQSLGLCISSTASVKSF